MGVVVWLFWFLSRTAPPPGTGLRLGWVFVIAGLLMHIIGRSQGIWMLDGGAYIPLLAGWLLLQGGRPWLRHFWFPLFYIIFILPETSMVIWLTDDLAAAVSLCAETIGYGLGYPIARDGVLLYIGSYQLLVAEACSGLNSMFSLSALGALYLYFQRDQSVMSRCIVLLFIVPVSFIANVVRVLVLLLVTYYFGDAAGQGFIHQFAGLLLFAVALGLLFVINHVLNLWLPKERGPV
jgi:exosortase